MDGSWQQIWFSRTLRRASAACSCALVAAVFLTDLNMPLGFAVPVLYAPAVLLAMLSRSRALVVAVALAGAVLTVAGVFLSLPPLPGVPSPFIAFHRVMALAAIGACAWMSLYLIGLGNRVTEARRELEIKSRMLDMAARLGKLGGWRVDLDSQHVHWSDEVARIHGRPAGYVPTVDEGVAHYPPEYRDAIRDRMAACAENGQPFDDDMQIVTVSGELRWVRCVGQPVMDERQKIIAIQGAFQDISDRKSTETRLRQSLAAWRNLAEAMPMTVWTATPDGIIDYVSQRMVDYTGARAAELVPGWLDFVHDEDRDGTMENWARAVEARGDYETHFRMRRQDGVYRWHLTRAVYVADSASGAAKWYGTSIDIDDYIRLQHEARSLAERLTATMESVGDAILMLDREWRVVFMNRHAEIMLDRRRGGLLGKVVWDEFPEAVGSTFEREYKRCMADNVSVRFEEYFDPLKKHFEVNAYPSEDGIAIYFRDVTRQRALAEQVIQAQKLESLGRLTGGVAHDFNNVLTVILGNAELLVEQSPPGSASHMLADMVLDAAQRGADMTQRLLAFARKQALEPRSVNLNRLIGGMDNLLRRTLGSHIDIEMVQSASLWQTLVDPGQLESSLLNLAINARDAMPGGGKLTIETANVRIDDNYAAREADIVAGQYVLLAVSDSGTGIAPDLLARVFEPFFTTKEAGKGTGLGLAMVYGFVKQSKGHVAIYSEPGKGTTVKIYLPRLAGAQALEQERSAPARIDTGSNQLILLVEDDEPVRTFARGLLEELGYRVLEAGSGPEALELLEQCQEIDLLFTDVVMPGGLSGRALADAAHALRPDLPVLYTSGYTENAIVHHGRLKPGVMLLSKPYRRAELAAKVALALAAGATNNNKQEMR